MANNASRTQIVSFLNKAKKLVSDEQYTFIPRQKNMQALAQHGLTIVDAKDEILGLVFADYYKGPKQDFDRPGYIWEFKKEISGVIFYIKLKIDDSQQGNPILKCIGFHDDDFS